MKLLPLFCLLILCAVPFALVQWSASATGPIAGKVLLAGGKAVYASYDGKVRAVFAENGANAWIYDTEELVSLEPQLASDNIVAVATKNGSLHFIYLTTGKAAASVRLGKYPFSFAAGGGNAYIALNDSVVAYSDKGRNMWNRTTDSLPGQLGYSGQTLYYTSSGKLYAVAPNSGLAKWSPSLSGDAYLSRPSEYQGIVYFGATDGKLYAVDYVSGRVRWSYKTDGWVMGTPVATSKSVYFGSADGNLYAVSTGGSLRWKFKTGGGVSTEPALYQNGDRIAVVFGSDDGNIYALESATGEEIWSFSSYGKPLSPSFNSGAFVFGTDKGKVYSLSPSPICSFTYPPSGEVVGRWIVDVEGRASSANGISSVEVRVGKGRWVPAQGKENWHAALDFSALNDGTVDVECRATDGQGRSESTEFSYITLIKADNAPLRKLYAVVPAQEFSPNETIAMRMQDARGHELYGVDVSVGGGQKKTTDSPASFVLGKSGLVAITLEKSGFEPLSISLLGSGGFDMNWLLVAVLVVLLAAIAYLFLGKRLFGRK